MKCNNCGYENKLDLKYCTQCGCLLKGSEESLSKVNKKNSSLLITAIVLVLILGIFIVGYFLLFKGESYKTSVKRMNNALSNIIKTVNTSGTIKMIADVSTDNEDVNSDNELISFIEYAKQDGDFYFHYKSEDNSQMDEFNMYYVFGESSLNYYVQSSIISNVYKNYDLNDFFNISSDKWFTYTINYDSLDFNKNDLDLIVNKLNFSKYFTPDNLKYIESKDGLSHYQIIFNSDLIKKFYDDNTKLLNIFNQNGNSFDDIYNQIKDINLVVDVYLSSNDEFVKLVIDLTDQVKKSTPYMKKSVLTFEFSDFNSTVITVPEDALNSNTMDLNLIFGDDNNSNISAVGGDINYDEADFDDEESVLKNVDDDVEFYQTYADYYGISLEEFLSQYVGIYGVTNEDELREYLMAEYEVDDKDN